MLRKSFTFLALIFAVRAPALPVEGHKLMVACVSPYAVEAARQISRAGGNVVDVAIAMELSLSVTSPYYASLGGGALALVKIADKPVTALDFRESAPLAAGPDYYKNLPGEASITGGRSVGVPGVAAGLWALHQKYGKLKWAQLFDPALKLAREGFPVTAEWIRLGKSEKSRLNEVGRQVFSRDLRPGDILKQPELAQALILFRDKKLAGFYQGAVARDIAESGADVTLADLAAYKVRWLEPLVTEFAGNKIYLMPPPSSGGVVIATALKLMEKINLQSVAPLSSRELHLMSEVEARAYRGRALLGDPDFGKLPVQFLTSQNYVDTLAKSVKAEKATHLEPLAENEIHESSETTHLSVMDSDGNAVALTVSLNGRYGSGLVTKRFHLALNDTMDDFTTHPESANMYGLTQGTANLAAPGKRPLSSFSPTLVEHEGKIVMSIGAPGGPRITSSVLQVLYRVLAQKLNLDWAVQAPRVHNQFRPEVTYVDEGRLSPDVIEALRKMGHKVEWDPDLILGKVYVVRLRPDGVLEGAFDSRGEGAAGGI